MLTFVSIFSNSYCYFRKKLQLLELHIVEGTNELFLVYENYLTNTLWIRL